MATLHELKPDALVASADGRRLGTVRYVLRRGVYRIHWTDGPETIEKREALLSCYSSSTPTRPTGDGKREPVIARGRVTPHVAGERERKVVTA
jgi:hypothetical protein